MEETSKTFKVGLQILNFLFFPILLPLYIIFFLIYIDPFYFIGFTTAVKNRFFSIFILNLIFFPLITLFLLKGLGFIKNFRFEEKKNRIIPFLALSIFYFWAFYLVKNIPSVPPIIIRLCLSFFILISLAPFFNFYSKISPSLGIIFCLLACLVYEKWGLKLGGYFSYALLIYSILLGGLLMSIKSFYHSNGEIRLSILLGFFSAFLTNFVIKFL